MNMKKGRATYMEKYRKDKEMALYEIIRLFSFKNGLLIEELSEMVGMDRKSIRPYLENLKKNKLIIRDKGGYVPANSISSDLIFRTRMFGESFIPVLDKTESLVLNDKKNSTMFDFETLIPDELYQQNRIYKSKNYDFTAYRSLYEPKFTERDSLEQLLFEFSNRIGAFATYLLVYCMNPDNYQDSLSLEGNDEYMSRSFEYGMKNANYQFMKVFAAKLRNLKDGEKIGYRGSNVLVNKNTFEEIMAAFVRIYPLMTFEFEQISDRRDHFREALDGWVPSKEDYNIKRKTFLNRLDEQRKCNHEFGHPKKSLLVDRYVQKCSKCGKIVNIMKAAEKKKSRKKPTKIE
jgi:hypothetical protein